MNHRQIEMAPTSRSAAFGSTVIPESVWQCDFFFLSMM